MTNKLILWIDKKMKPIRTWYERHQDVYELGRAYAGAVFLFFMYASGVWKP
jgi:hypothetical protein